eukprot:scaffold24789_cov122-Isochrysis_galbana.AAC.4
MCRTCTHAQSLARVITHPAHPCNRCIPSDTAGAAWRDDGRAHDGRGVLAPAPRSAAASGTPHQPSAYATTCTSVPQPAAESVTYPATLAAAASDATSAAAASCATTAAAAQTATVVAATRGLAATARACQPAAGTATSPVRPSAPQLATIACLDNRLGGCPLHRT